CVGAIAAYRSKKTSRQIFREELPSRFIFNWGDTLRSSASYEAFYAKLTSRSNNDILRSASAELWTVIFQHSKKHKNFRMGVRFFRSSLILFLLLFVSAMMRRFL
ncbi:hypothetical protein, partial [Actinocorallia aurantiaca]|uniref:hypothetical protein n=1 Tax=Actinocorallia aurantiaca TaxID=46204 RepID=UPI0031E40327